MKTLILGIGNPILSDDGVGIYVARKAQSHIDRDDVDFAEASISGLSIIDLVRGYDRLFLVDAIQTEGGRPGDIYRLGLDEIREKETLHFSISHDVDIETALRLGRELGEKMPSEVVIYAIEAENLQDFSDKCTPEVEKAIPLAARKIAEELLVA